MCDGVSVQIEERKRLTMMMMIDDDRTTNAHKNTPASSYANANDT